jgi:hypothetical protein
MTQPGALRFGRLPNDPSRPRVRLTARPAAYDPPAAVDWHTAVPAGSWGMDGNDAVGDCTLAEVDHTTKATEVAAGNPEVQSTAAEVLAAYSAITGYDPADPSTDQGAEMQQVRDWWRKRGVTLGGRQHTIALFAELDHRNLGLVKWAVAQFGPVGLGINCPRSALDQFNAGQPWTVVRGSPDDGGHAIAFVGYDDQWAYVLTWGRVQRMSWGFFAAYVEEAWTQLSQEWVSAATGADPLAGTLHDLGEQFHAVTGLPNPFPTPGPVPPGPPPFPRSRSSWIRRLLAWLRRMLGEQG